MDAVYETEDAVSMVRVPLAAELLCSADREDRGDDEAA